MAQEKVNDMASLSVEQLQERFNVSHLRAAELYAMMHGDIETLDDVKADQE